MAFYAIHEVPDKERVLQELASLLKPGDRILIAEQKGHVIRKDFEEITRIALCAGLRIVPTPENLYQPRGADGKTLVLTVQISFFYSTFNEKPSQNRQKVGRGTP